MEKNFSTSPENQEADPEAAPSISSSSSNQVTSNTTTKKLFRFKKKEKKIKKPVVHKKIKSSFSRMNFLRFIVFFIRKSLMLQLFLAASFLLIVINEIAIRFLEHYEQKLFASSTTGNCNKMLILKVTSLLTQSLANIMKPIYADHIGSVLQFYFFQNIALDTKKAKRSPFTHMTAADIYSLTYRHSDTLEAASAAFLYDLPFGIYSLFKTISYTKIDRKEYAITSLTIVTLFMVV